MISYKDNQKCAAGEKAQRSIFHQSVSIGEITAQKNLFFLTVFYMTSLLPNTYQLAIYKTTCRSSFSGKPAVFCSPQKIDISWGALYNFYRYHAMRIQIKSRRCPREKKIYCPSCRCVLRRAVCVQRHSSCKECSVHLRLWRLRGRIHCR